MPFFFYNVRFYVFLIPQRESTHTGYLLVFSLAPVPLINSWLSSVTNVPLPSSSPGERGGVFNVQFVLWIDVFWHRLTLTAPCVIPLPPRFTRFSPHIAYIPSRHWLDRRRGVCFDGQTRKVKKKEKIRSSGEEKVKKGTAAALTSAFPLTTGPYNWDIVRENYTKETDIKTPYISLSMYGLH